MKTNKAWVTGFLVVLAGAMLLVPPAAGQDPADADKETSVDTELVYRQERIKKELRKLTARMLEVADLLAESEPIAAKAIRQAVQKAKGADIEGDMDKVMKELTKGLLVMAGTKQKDVVENLRKVLRALQSDPTELSSAAQIRQWEQTLERITKLKKDEEAHEKKSRLAAKGEEVARRLRELGEQYRDLIERQKKILADTKKLPDAATAAGKLAKARAELREIIADQTKLKEQTAESTVGKLLLVAGKQRGLGARAGKLAGELGKLAADPGVGKALGKAGLQSGAMKAAAGYVQSGAGEMGKAAGRLDATDAGGAGGHQERALGDLKAAEKALTEAIGKLAAGTKAGALAKKQSGLAGEAGKLAAALDKALSDAGMGQSGSPGKSGQPGQSGQSGQKLQRAAGHMATAAEKLQEQARDPAAEAEKRALAEMEEDARKLGELARKIAKEAKEIDPKKDLKPEQDKTGREARQLAKNMGPKSSDSGKPTPGQKSVSGAAGSMGQASGKLGQGKAGGANEDQKRAVKQLGDAERELAEAIDKARKDMQNEALTQIDQILRGVLEAQRKLTKDTTELHAGRKGEKYDRLELGKLADLSDGEGEQGEKVGKVLKMVKDEGTTAVFPLVLDETKAELANVQKLLAQKKAGPLTQSIQKEIEKNLEEMIEALQKEIRRRKGGGGSGRGGGGGKPPLVPPVAELKMLRTLQRQINRRTLTLDAAKRGGSAAGIDMRLLHKIVSDREKRLADMTKTLNEKTSRRQPSGPVRPM